MMVETHPAELSAEEVREYIDDNDLLHFGLPNGKFAEDWHGEQREQVDFLCGPVDGWFTQDRERFAAAEPLGLACPGCREWVHA